MDYLAEFHEQMMLVRLKQNDDKNWWKLLKKNCNLT